MNEVQTDPVRAMQFIILPSYVLLHSNIHAKDCQEQNIKSNVTFHMLSLGTRGSATFTPTLLKKFGTLTFGRQLHVASPRWFNKKN